MVHVLGLVRTRVEERVRDVGDVAEPVPIVARQLVMEVAEVEMFTEMSEPLLKKIKDGWQSGVAKNITFIVTKDCQLACKYCYLVGKMGMKGCHGKQPKGPLIIY